MTLGERLKALREMNGLEIETLSEKIKIGTSRLTQLESDGIDTSPEELRLLAKFYRIPLVELFCAAGYLTEDDLLQYQRVFSGTELLTEDEKYHIQEFIHILEKNHRAEQG